MQAHRSGVGSDVKLNFPTMARFFRKKELLKEDNDKAGHRN